MNALTWLWTKKQLQEVSERKIGRTSEVLHIRWCLIQILENCFKLPKEEKEIFSKIKGFYFCCKWSKNHKCNVCTFISFPTRFLFKLKIFIVATEMKKDS